MFEAVTHIHSVKSRHKQHNNFVLFFWLLSCMFFCFLLIYSQPAEANEQSSDEFEQLIVKVDVLKNSDLNAAFTLLISFENKLEMISTEQQILFYKTLSQIYIDQGQFNLGKNTAIHGLELTKNLNSPTILIAELLYLKGFSYESLGDSQTAERDYENGLAIARSLNNKVFIANGLLNLGAIYYLSERFKRSLTVLNNAYTLANETDDEELKGAINSELSILYTYLNQQDKSLEFSLKSYQHFLKAGKTLYAYNSLNAVAQNQTEKKEFTKAIIIYQELLKNIGDIESDYLLFSIYSGMSWAYLKQADSNPEMAYKYINLAEKYVTNTEQHSARFYHLVNKAVILDELHRYDEALDVFEELDKIQAQRQGKKTRWIDVQIINTKANILFSLGKFKEAYPLKTIVIKAIVKLRAEDDFAAIEDLRLRYESEQADLVNNILEKNKQVNALELKEANQAVQQQNVYLVISAILTLIFIWLFIKLIYAQKNLLKASRTDSLTQVNNHSRIMKLGERAFKRAKNTQQSLAVIMIDVDHFKKINDNFGHIKGDQALFKISDIINNITLESGSLGRYGGEEFIVFLVDKSPEFIQQISQKLLLGIENYHWPYLAIDPVTISLGVATINTEKDNNLDILIHRADKMLYQAKAQGRNKACYDEK